MQKRPICKLIRHDMAQRAPAEHDEFRRLKTEIAKRKLELGTCPACRHRPSPGVGRLDFYGPADHGPGLTACPRKPARRHARWRNSSTCCKVARPVCGPMRRMCRRYCLGCAGSAVETGRPMAGGRRSGGRPFRISPAAPFASRFHAWPMQLPQPVCCTPGHPSG